MEMMRGPSVSLGNELSYENEITSMDEAQASEVWQLDAGRPNVHSRRERSKRRAIATDVDVGRDESGIKQNCE